MKTSLYIHVPFCRVKCPYCSFPVVVGQESRRAAYLVEVGREMARHAGASVVSLHVGGGTPSALSEADIAGLAAAVRKNFIIAGREWACELNPESVTRAKADAFRSAGFTRASLGAQSFREKYLRQLGRPHERNDASRAFRLLREAGFDNINVDLMFGFPGQTMAEIDADLDDLLSLGSEHVSLYALTVDDHSLFHARGVKVCDDQQAEGYRRACARLNAAGLGQYEVSNFAREGFRSAHNLNYWQGGDYIGVGMGAHSHSNGVRSWNAGTFPRYMAMMKGAGNAEEGREQLDAARKMTETFLFGLRMVSGVDMASLQARFGCLFSPELYAGLDALAAEGFIVREGARARVTDKGRLVLDEISARLI